MHILVKKNIVYLLLAQLLLCAIGLSMGGYLQAKKVVHTYSDKMYKYTTIETYDVSNMTATEAKNYLLEQYITPILNSKLTLIYNNQPLHLSLNQFIVGHNLDSVINKALCTPKSLSLVEQIALLSGCLPLSYDINFEINHAALKGFIADFLSRHTIDAKDAYISISNQGEISITPSKPAIHWDESTLYTALYKLVENLKTDTLNLDLYKTTTAPNISEDILTQIDTRIAHYETTFKARSGNATNITVAAQTISDTLLMPGDIFSFNECVGDTTLEKGYTYAPVIINSKLVDGLGGGVCQVSSTLYNAILLCGLSPLERQPHSRPSSYVPLGLDATIYWQTIDFKFQNTFDYPLYIKSYTEDNQLHVDLYSNKALAEHTYTLYSKVYETIDSPVNYIYDSKLPKNTLVLASSGQQGYKVKTYRECYQDNRLINTSIISTDTYKAIPTVYKLGTENR